MADLFGCPLHTSFLPLRRNKFVILEFKTNCRAYFIWLPTILQSESDSLASEF